MKLQRRYGLLPVVLMLGACSTAPKVFTSGAGPAPVAGGFALAASASDDAQTQAALKQVETKLGEKGFKLTADKPAATLQVTYVVKPPGLAAFATAAAPAPESADWLTAPTKRQGRREVALLTLKLLDAKTGEAGATASAWALVRPTDSDISAQLAQAAVSKLMARAD